MQLLSAVAFNRSTFVKNPSPMFLVTLRSFSAERIPIIKSTLYHTEALGLLLLHEVHMIQRSQWPILFRGRSSKRPSGTIITIGLNPYGGVEHRRRLGQSQCSMLSAPPFSRGGPSCQRVPNFIHGRFGIRIDDNRHEATLTHPGNNSG